MGYSVAEFVRAWVASGLVEEAAAESFVVSLPAAPESVEALGKELVRSGTLTKFQVQTIYQGKGKSLLLGNYAIREKIGAGGMGQVFLAEHRRMKRRVALKVLPAETMRDPQAVERFRREVEAAARLNHPHIVTAYDADETKGVHFLVMEHVDGEDLASLVKRHGRFSVPQAIGCVLQAARGLQYAHERGVVHRDVKPSNLLLSREGTVKILDMGLACLSGADGLADHELTGTGVVMGTLDYISPEQGMNSKHADARSDVYSLGCTLYFLLTARPMYASGTAVEKILAHRERPIPSLLEVRPDIPADLETLYRRMVAKQPDDRCQTMAEVVTGLEPLQARAGDGGGTVTLPPRSGPGAAAGAGDAAVDPAQQSPLLWFFERQQQPDVKSTLLAPARTAVSADATVSSGFQQETRRFAVPAAKRPKKGRNSTGRRRSVPVPWLLGGGAAALLLTLGIWVIIRDKDGNETARIRVPDGGSFTAQDETETTTTTPTAPQPVPAWQPTPEQQAFLDEVAALPVADQAAAVARKLQEVNPGFDGQFTHTIEAGKVTEFDVSSLAISQIWPVRALPDLATLRCTGIDWRNKGHLEDISPLAGMPLTRLFIDCTLVSDLTPLTGMKLTQLNCGNTRVRDLSPLAGMPLSKVTCNNTQVADLTPLAGMRLTSLAAHNSSISDLSPLTGMLLTYMTCHHTRVSDLAPLTGMPLRILECDHTLVTDFQPVMRLPLRRLMLSVPLFHTADAEVLRGNRHISLGVSYDKLLDSDMFWAEHAARREAAEAFAAETAEFPVEEQVPAVLAKLRAGPNGANIGFGPLIRDGAVVEANVTLPGKVDDVTPLRALTGLRKLTVNGGPGWLDLSPINTLPLEELTCSDNQALRNAPMLAAIPTLTTINGRPAAEYLESLRATSPSARAVVPDVAAWQPTPEQQAFITEVAALPVEEQAAAVGRKLAEINPGFDGQFTHKIEAGNVTEFEVSAIEITDLWPVQALPDLVTLGCVGTRENNGKLRDLSPLAGMTFTRLRCCYTQVSDLSPLAGREFTFLDCGFTQVSDLSPLAGMKLASLLCGNTRVSDLTPLAGMPLTYLYCGETRVSDLSPLAGMPLTELYCHTTSVSDLSPLAGMPLATLSCEQTLVPDFQLLAGMPLSSLTLSVPLFHAPDEELVRELTPDTLGKRWWENRSAEEFWQEFTARREAAETFAAETSALPAEEQVQAVLAKLRAGPGGANIEFSPTIRDGAIQELVITAPWNADDVTPLRALTGLRKLTVNGGPGWLDLSPINTLPLEELTCSEDQALRNAPMLAAIPTLKTINGQPAAEYLAAVGEAISW